MSTLSWGCSTRIKMGISSTQNSVTPSSRSMPSSQVSWPTRHLKILSNRLTSVMSKRCWGTGRIFSLNKPSRSLPIFGRHTSRFAVLWYDFRNTYHYLDGWYNMIYQKHPPHSREIKVHKTSELKYFWKSCEMGGNCSIFRRYKKSGVEKLQTGQK